ncbi:MAG: XRE family transcriptional regulator [Pseudomonadota bacterium]
MPALYQDDLPDTDTLESVVAFGLEVRQLRKARRMTLAQLADASGISLSHVSAIERGAVNASLDKVNRLADALSVPVAWFFARRSGEGPLERAHVVRTKNRRNLNLVYGETAEQSGYTDWLLSSTIGGAFYFGVSEYPPHAPHHRDEIVVRDGEQHGLVLEGEIELVLRQEVITLRAGDSFSIPADIPHRTRNRSNKTAKMIWVNSPVIIPEECARAEDMCAVKDEADQLVS